MKKYHLYAIGKKEHLQEPYDLCYIGVTNNTQLRWKNHQKSKYSVGKYIREYDLTFEENMCVIFSGNEEVCFDMESKYRPLPFLGLNEAVGGKGGYTKYTTERNQIISTKMKEARKRKKWITTQNRNTKGEKNPNAKSWEIVSPNGERFLLKGNFTKFCNDQSLLETSLRYYKNKQVPNINTNGFGGYRAKNEISEKLRSNTTGWALYEVPGGVKLFC